ncbi:unnamed protein product [Durusdinium trenchii]|uniref:Uncharacterized protein n=1 Tax=Durusdinium trenchii TaxID=1381693 RepID=A0ABP0NYP3_9DINO
MDGQFPRPLALGATTIVMRSTHLKLTTQEIMTLLNVLTVTLGYKSPMYDFVYMPWAKLAIVNFVDHRSCKAFYEKIQEVIDLGAEHPAIRNIAQSYIQGLPQNLAFFLAKSGQQAIYQAHAPMVFENGVRMELLDAVNKYVSIELLLSMEQTLADNVREMGLQNSWPRSGKGKSSGKGLPVQRQRLGWRMPWPDAASASGLTDGYGSTSEGHAVLRSEFPLLAGAMVDPSRHTVYDPSERHSVYNL